MGSRAGTNPEPLAQGSYAGSSARQSCKRTEVEYGATAGGRRRRVGSAHEL